MVADDEPNVDPASQSDVQKVYVAMLRREKAYALDF